MACENVVGFLGLDDLSLELAASLLRSGYAVQAFETCGHLLDEFTKQGGNRCVNPVEAGKDVVALVVLISHVDQINDLLFGQESALKGLHKDAVIILHSTILPAHIQKLQKRLTEDSEMAFVVDVYVFRGMWEVLKGNVMMISSGGSDSMTRAQPILSAMCNKLYVFEGEHGAGSKIKMVTELLEGIHFVASVEAISLGAQAGIHPWILYDIISNAAGNSWVFKNLVPQLLRGVQTKHLLNTFVQSLEIVLDMAKSCTFPLPLLAVAHQQLIAGSSHSSGNDDAKLIKAWEKVYGVNITAAANEGTYSPEQLGNQLTAEANSVNRIGFIGLGAMGFGMATQLLKSNFCVLGYDVYHPTLSRFANEGGLVGSSPAEVSKDVDVLVIMVTNEAQAESVLFGDHGAISALPSGASIILASTVSPAYVSQLEQRLHTAVLPLTTHGLPAMICSRLTETSSSIIIVVQRHTRRSRVFFTLG